MADNDFDFEENKDKLELKNEDKENTEFEDFEDEVDIEKPFGAKEDEEEKEEEKEEEEVDEVEEKKDLSAEEKQDKDAMEDAIKHLDGKTKYIIKGKEYDLTDLTPQEFKDRFSKAGRFYEHMDELSDREKAIQLKEQQVNQNALTVQQLMNQYGKGGASPSANVPAFLKPDDLDDDNTKALKQTLSAAMQKIDNLERGQQDTYYRSQEQMLLGEIDSLSKEYPLASREEVIAIKAMYPNVDTRKAMSKSHEHYVSDDYLNKVFDARPDARREFEEKAVKAYQAKKAKSGGMSRRPAKTSGGKKVSTKEKKPKGFDYDFNDAEADSVDYIREQMNESNE